MHPHAGSLYVILLIAKVVKILELVLFLSGESFDLPDKVDVGGPLLPLV